MFAAELDHPMAPAARPEPAEPPSPSPRPPSPSPSPPLIDLPPNVLESITRLAGPPSRQACLATLAAYGPLLASRPHGIHTPADLLHALETLASRSPTLQTLDLTHCACFLEPPLALRLPAHTPRLRHLTLRNCSHLTPPALRAIAALPLLTTLDLHRCHPALTPATLAIITEGQAAAGLRRLALDLHPEATDSTEGAVALCELSNLRQLRTLSLSRISNPRLHWRDIVQQGRLASALAPPRRPPPTQPPGPLPPPQPPPLPAAGDHPPPMAQLLQLGAIPPDPAAPPNPPIPPNPLPPAPDIPPAPADPPLPIVAAPAPDVPPAPADPPPPNLPAPADPPPAPIVAGPVPFVLYPDPLPFELLDPFLDEDPLAPLFPNMQLGPPHPTGRRLPAPEAVAALLEVTSGLPHLHTLHLRGSLILQDTPPDPSAPLLPHQPAPPLASALLTLNRGLICLSCSLGTPLMRWQAPGHPHNPNPAPLLEAIGSMAGHLRHLDLTLTNTCSDPSLRACIERLDRLASLSLTFNSCPTPLIVDAISQNMTQLTSLRLAASTGMPGFDDLPQTEWLRDLAPTLRVLDLAQGPSLGLRALQAIASLTGLTELHLTKRTGQLDRSWIQPPTCPNRDWELENLSQLQVLHLEGQELCAWALPQRPHLPSLTALRLHRASFSTAALLHICDRMPHLRTLDLRSSCASFRARELGLLRRLTQLQELHLTLNTISGLVAASLQHLLPPPPALKRLWLSLLAVPPERRPIDPAGTTCEDLRGLAAALAEHGCAVLLQMAPGGGVGSSFLF